MRNNLLLASAIALAMPAFAQTTDVSAAATPGADTSATQGDIHAGHDMSQAGSMSNTTDTGMTGTAHTTGMTSTTDSPAMTGATDTNVDADFTATTQTGGTADVMAGTNGQTGYSGTATAAQGGAMMASSQIVQPGNSNPEQDSRGIAVISAPAAVPAGWNGIAGTAMGGPVVDPATGEAVGSEQDYPACSASVTDNCVQTYERGRR